MIFQVKMDDEHFSLQGVVLHLHLHFIFLHFEALFGKKLIEAEMNFLAQ